jgi:organic hydroperoxide reductase OsmC/OhrA
VSEAWPRKRLKRGEPKYLKTHNYEVSTVWTGNTGEGTGTYEGYARDHIVQGEGKPSIKASSDPAFRGDASRYNPEELLVASLSSCHMLWYLHLCSMNAITVLEYKDRASGQMEEDSDGSGRIVQVVLRPEVWITPESDPVRAKALHEEAHDRCFIANSVNFPVKIEF